LSAAPAALALACCACEQYSTEHWFAQGVQPLPGAARTALLAWVQPGSSSSSDPGFNRTTVDGVSSFDMWIQTPKKAIVKVFRNGRTHFNWRVDTAAARLTITGFASDLTIRIIDPHPVIVSIYNLLIALIATGSSILACLRNRLGNGGLIVVGLVLTFVVVMLIIFAPMLARFIVHWTEGATPA